MLVRSSPDVEAKNNMAQTFASRGRRAPAATTFCLLRKLTRTNHVLVKETSFVLDLEIGGRLPRACDELEQR
jgi:hypothetical protein